MNLNCLADKIFEETVIEHRAPKKGLKFCSNCNCYVGVRTKLCECGHVFVKGESKKPTKYEEDKKVESATDEEKKYAMLIGAYDGRIVYAGTSIKVKLEELSEVGIRDFCDEVVFEGLNEGKIYSIKALKYFMQHLYGYTIPEYQEACQFIDLWYNNLLEQFNECS